MNKTLVLTEKKDAAKMIAVALKIKTNDLGGYFESAEYYLTWAQGHLIETCQPEYYDKTYARWSLEDLPILPDELATQAAKQHSKKVKTIKELINKSSQVVNACDCGQEGELIARLIFKHCGFIKPHKRLWYTSLIKDEIIRAFSDLKNSADFDDLYICAWFRNYLDWTFGINLTRALTLKISSAGDGVINTGRVTTPTLNALVERQLEIDNFKPEPYRVLTFEKDGFKYTSDRIEDRLTGPSLFKSFTISDSEKKEQTQKPPRLFSLNTLQKEANKVLGFKAKKTLELAEQLYLSAMISYPRSEAEVLPENFDVELLKSVVKQNGVSFDINPSDKRIFDTSKIEDHHAIIPTTQNKSIDNKDQKDLYNLIVKRFMAAFAEDSTSLLIKIVGNSNNLTFKSTKTFITYEGFKKIYSFGADDGQETEPQILKDPGSLLIPQKSDTFDISPQIDERTTKPPAFYTDASLISFMQNAGKAIDEKLSGGIGTVATRAQIIEKLEHNNFIIYKGKNIMATDKAIKTITLIPLAELKKPYLTLELEQLFEEIKQGHKTFDQCRQLSNEKLLSFFEEIKTMKQADRFEQSEYQCLVCQKNLTKSKYSYNCPDHPDFSLPYTLLGKKLADKDLKDLLSGLSTGIIKGFKGKSKFDASLSLDLKTFKIKFNFPSDITEEFEFDKTCPQCGGETLKIGKFGIYCSGSCTGERAFSIPNKIRETPISTDNMLRVLNGDKTESLNFTSAKGKYTARLFLKNDHSLGFEF